MYLILNTLKFKFVNEIFRNSFSYINSNILLHSYKYLAKVHVLKTFIGSNKWFFHIMACLSFFSHYIHACTCISYENHTRINSMQLFWSQRDLLRLKNFGWHLFFFFLVSSNLADISSCETWAIHYFGKSMQTLPQ